MGLDLTKLASVADEVGSLLDDAKITPASDLHTLHTDGDYAAYYFSGNDDTPLGTAKKNMVAHFEAAATISGAFTNKVYVHITDPMSDKGQRYRIATVKDYQDNRGKSAKPKNWQGMRDFLQAGMPGSNMVIVNWTDREADDGAAFMTTADIETGRRPTILWRDKDWKIFPGNHMRWLDLEQINVPPGAFEVIDDEGTVYGHKFFWLQMLMGDTADNIPGLEKITYINAKGQPAAKNCGEVCAAEVLAGTENNEQAYYRVAQAYEEFYGPGWEVRFAEQAMLLWMRTGGAHINDFLQIIPAARVDQINKAVQFIQRRMQR